MPAPGRPNLLFILADQLRAASTPLNGECPAPMPNMRRLAREGVTFTNALSTCPLCTPYRAMLLTGRHPQTTGHVVNFVNTRPEEIDIGDVFAAAGYRTGWVGKWHLTAGHFPKTDQTGPDYIPDGRARLGFEYFRGYNYHTVFFNGWISLDGGRSEQWEGYETDGLMKYVAEFFDRDDGRPFSLFVSPHQPHSSAHRPCVPEEYLKRVPADLPLPPNVPDESRPKALEMQRHYLAMTVALDDMLGRLLQSLDRMGKADNTLVVFASDHGTMGGAHGVDPWCKKFPYEESIRVPLVARLPGALGAGERRDALVAPVDLLPTLAALCGIRPPGAVEGYDLSQTWLGRPGAFEQEAVLTMNFTGHPDLAIPPADPRYRPHYKPWRGIRTKRHSYIRWVDGEEALYDLAEDPFQMNNLMRDSAMPPLADALRGRLTALLEARGDRFPPSEGYADWFDADRRIVRNAFGPLGDPS